SRSRRRTRRLGRRTERRGTERRRGRGGRGGRRAGRRLRRGAERRRRHRRLLTRRGRGTGRIAAEQVVTTHRRGFGCRGLLLRVEGRTAGHAELRASVVVGT